MANEKLILASEAKAKLKAFHDWFGGPVQMQGDLLARKVIEMCIEEIDKLEPVDAVEVVHGRWEVIEASSKLYRCSVCGVWQFVPGEQYAYCPYCGAKMDGERRTDNA